MKIAELNQKQLDTFCAGQKHSQFLQSWQWGEFQKNLGKRVFRLGVVDEENEDILAAGQIIETELPFRQSYLYCPRGPIMLAESSEINESLLLKMILKGVRDITIKTKNKSQMFFRFEPLTLSEKISGLAKTADIQPSLTLLTDLSQAQDALERGLHPKTKYNINLAEKKGVAIAQVKPERFNQAWPLFSQTSKRDNFNLHPQNYYQTMLAGYDLVKLWLASYGDKIIAAALVGYFGDTATYLHGASSYEHRPLMAPQLLHWQIILDAKNLNYHYYDWHGITGSDDPRHPWSGITRFKKGFGGEVFALAGTYDFLYEKSWYKMYKILRQINRWLKR